MKQFLFYCLVVFFVLLLVYSFAPHLGQRQHGEGAANTEQDRTDFAENIQAPIEDATQIKQQEERRMQKMEELLDREMQ